MNILLLENKIEFNNTYFGHNSAKRKNYFIILIFINTDLINFN
jgi:hypothetical protein